MFQDGYIFKECTSSFTFSASATRMTFIQKMNDSDIFNGLYFQLQYQSFAPTQMNSGKTIITSLMKMDHYWHVTESTLNRSFGEDPKKKNYFHTNNWAMKKNTSYFPLKYWLFNRNPYNGLL